ncbi:MAG: fibronectin type III domain-containing protein [Opitutales bacterium]|nr:fibronectin type III domain-containing protein [Opitutales bacterium]
MNASAIRFASLLAAAALLAPAPCARAQADAEDLLFAAGTSTAPEDGMSWVFITWWAGEFVPDLDPYAVYLKTGDADSTDTYSLAGIARPRTDPFTIQVLLTQAAALGDDLGALETNIDGLFDKLVPLDDLTLAQKIAAVVYAAPTTPETAESLFLLSRRHPAMALASGRAFALPLPAGQIYTFEVRACPPGTPVDAAACDTVVGRVTLTPGDYLVLPPPGPAVNIPFADTSGARDSRGDLNAPLRWATPPDLRLLSLHNFGHNIYRIDADFAEAQGFHLNPPAPGDLPGLLSGNPDEVRRINRLPVLAAELLTLAEAADATHKPELRFFVDDNDKYFSDNPSFEDGDSFYYYITARDLLGRDGELSDGTLVVICSIFPPAAPMNVQVTNDYSYDVPTRTQTQIFRVTWPSVPTGDGEPEISGYWVYRWHSIEEMLKNEGFPMFPAGPGVGGRIATVGPNVTSITDTAPGYPSITYTRGPNLEDDPVVNQTQAGVTWWYTVRAIDDSVCGGNLSPHSGPAFGVLRDRVGPKGPGGFVRKFCRPLVLRERDRREYLETNDFKPDVIQYQLGIFRDSTEIDTVEVYHPPLSGPESLVHVAHFTGRADDPATVKADLYWPHSTPAHVILIATTRKGERSEPTSVPLTMQPGSTTIEVVTLDATFDREPRECPRHQTVDPLTGNINPLDIFIDLTPTTQEWKVYRRVDNGPLTLLQQGLASFDDVPTVILQDEDLPLNGGRVCYFAQLFDQHGNPSPMVPIDCVEVGPRIDPPTPMLAPVVSLGESGEGATARIEWFCPPHGVERFEFWVAEDDMITETHLTDEWRLNMPPPPSNDPLFAVRHALIDGMDVLFYSFLTRRIGPMLPDAPEYAVTLDDGFKPGAKYRVRVRAVTANGAVGAWSNEEVYQWAPKPEIPFAPDDCELPWPALSGLPVFDEFILFPLNAPVEVGLKAFMHPVNHFGVRAYTGGAVRVGVVGMAREDAEWVTERLPRGNDSIGEFPGETPIFYLPASVNPSLMFYRRVEGTSLVPFALYRYQVPNGEWAEVSGDIYQVTPLIENIATRIGTLPNIGNVLEVHDPYFFLVPAEAPTGNPELYFHLFVKDTQPVTKGADYRYLLVRYAPNGEVAGAQRLGPVSAP